MALLEVVAGEVGHGWPLGEFKGQGAAEADLLSGHIEGLRLC